MLLGEALRSIYYEAPYRNLIVEQLRTPFASAVARLVDPQSSLLNKVKAANQLRKLLPVINSLPEPTLENTSKKGSHILIGIRDRFFARLVLPSRSNILRAIVNGAIIIYETDFYQGFIDWWVWALKKSDWPAMGPMQPDPHFFKPE